MRNQTWIFSCPIRIESSKIFGSREPKSTDLFAGSGWKREKKSGVDRKGEGDFCSSFSFLTVTKKNPSPRPLLDFLPLPHPSWSVWKRRESFSGFFLAQREDEKEKKVGFPIRVPLDKGLSTSDFTLTTLFCHFLTEQKGESKAFSGLIWLRKWFLCNFARVAFPCGSSDSLGLPVFSY